MKKNISYILIVIFGIGIVILLISSYLGWYGYEKWKYRVQTKNIDDSKSRGVFVKQLNYKVEGDLDSSFKCKPYIEKGFRFGYHSMEDTRIIDDSKYPYQLNYNINRKKFVVTIDRNQFDSSDVMWGYLKEPYLKDTIIISVEDTNRHSGIVKVWDSTH